MQHPNGLVLDRPESAPADIPASCPSWCIVDHTDPDKDRAGRHHGRYIEVVLAGRNRFVAQLWGDGGDLKMSLQFAKANLFDDDDSDHEFDPEDYHEVNLALPTASGDLALILPAIEAVIGQVTA
jgi:hypothetical protein